MHYCCVVHLHYNLQHTNATYWLFKVKSLQTTLSGPLEEELLPFEPYLIQIHVMYTANL